jgi:hypothetical protein
MLLELLIDLYTLPIIDQEIRDLRNAVAQLSRTLQTLQTATAQTAQTAPQTETAPQTATAPEGLSLSPVRDTNKGNRKLSPMSRSFKKTLHVNYIYLY